MVESEIQVAVVAEDDEDLAEAIAEQLDDLGYRVHVALDGETAMVALLHETPAMMLIDIGLPKHDGIAITRRTRRRGETFPIIAITGWGDPAIHERALAAGCDQILVKPFTIDDLCDAIARARARA